jgi:hypothetical protein
MVKALLKGRPPPFYRRMLHGTAIPVKRLRRKTTPAPRFAIPAHLRHLGDAPTPTPRRSIRLTRSTVIYGPCLSRLDGGNDGLHGSTEAVPDIVAGGDEDAPMVRVGVPFVTAPKLPASRIGAKMEVTLSDED